MTLDDAIDVFVGAMQIARSYTFPCETARIGPVWVFRDAERKHGDYRNEEWIAYGTSPREIDEVIRKHTRGKFAVCFIRRLHEPIEPIKVEFKSMGYRLNHREPFFVHSLKTIEPVGCNYPVDRVTTQAEVDRLTRETRRRQILLRHLTELPPKIRLYWALDGENPIGWTRSVRPNDGATWCAGLYVKPEFRRQGIGRALMTRMLREDRNAGAVGNVLLASSTGAKLYRTLGYDEIGELMVLTPRKR